MKLIKSIRKISRLSLLAAVSIAAVGVLGSSQIIVSEVAAVSGSDNTTYKIAGVPKRDDEVDPNYGVEDKGIDTTVRAETSILPDNLDAVGLLVMAIWIMTAGIGVAAVGGIVWGAILYTTAGGSQEKTKKGIEIIRNVVIGLLLYVFMFAIINFLIPGGVIT